MISRITFCSAQPAMIRSARSGHELAKADNVGEFPVAYPAAVLDGDAARPDNSAAAADTAEGDGEERGKKRGERNRPLHVLLLGCRLSHLSAFLASGREWFALNCSCW
jgi:hypothetical protein